MKYLLLLLTTLVATNCREKPAWVTVPAGAEPTPSSVNLSSETVLLLADYPPQENPYWLEGDDFWLVHTPEGERFAFAPVSPEYADHITVDDCRYTWSASVRRFVDPCSGDEWELDGTLNLEHSIERWSNRDLDRYPVSIREGEIIVQLNQLIPGTAVSAVPSPTPRPTPIPTATTFLPLGPISNVTRIRLVTVSPISSPSHRIPEMERNASYCNSQANHSRFQHSANVPSSRKATYRLPCN